MRKLFKEEKNACVKRTVSSLIIFLLFFSTRLFSQQNDFPVYEISIYSTTIGLSDIFVANIDDEPPYDLIFYNDKNLGYTYHSSARLNKPKKKYFFYPITSLKLFKNRLKDVNAKYIFTSENSGIVGLVSFTKYGGMRLLNVKHTKDYPSHIDVGKFLAYPERRAIVFGKNFNGLAVFSEKNFKLEENNYFDSSYFSAGGLVDIDIDGMNDLVLYNNPKRNLLYLLNVTNSFQLTKSETIKRGIRKFKVNDFDGDRIRDFSFLTGDSLRVYIVNSNPKNIKHISLFVNKCLDYKFLKINNDRLTDILTIDSLGRTFAYYNKGGNKFTKGEQILSLTGAKAMATVWNLDRRRVVILSDKGNFVTLEKTSLIDTTKQILLAGKSKLPVRLVETNSDLKIYWSSLGYPQIRELRISKRSGKIGRKILESPFLPDNFNVTANNFLLLDKYLSDGFSFFIKREKGQTGIFNDTLNTDVIGNLFVKRFSDSLQVLRPKFVGGELQFDSLKITPKPMKLLIAKGNRIVYLTNNKELVFSHFEKENKAITDTLYSIKKYKELFEIDSPENKTPYVIQINGRNLKLYSPDSVKIFYSSKYFSTGNVIPYYIEDVEEPKIFVYNKKTGMLLKAFVKKGKERLRFHSVNQILNVSNYRLVKINKKLFFLYFDKAINSLNFKEIL